MIGKISRAPTFRRLLDYAGNKEDSQLLETNLPHDDLGELAASMTAHSRLSPTRKPCYHISVSPSQDDDLEETDWLLVLDRILEQMQLQHLHQYASFLHFDATYGKSGIVRPHLHLIANLIGFDGRAASTFDDYGRLETTLRSLEIELGLQPTESAKTERFPIHRQPGFLGSTVEQALKVVTSADDLFAYLREFDIEPQRKGRGWRVSWEQESLTGQQLGFPWSRVCQCLLLNQTMVDRQEPKTHSQSRLDRQKFGDLERNLERMGDRAASKLFLTGDLIASATKLGTGLTQIGREISGAGQEITAAITQERVSKLVQKLEPLAERATRLAEARGIELSPQPTFGQNSNISAQIAWFEETVGRLNPERTESPSFRQQFAKLSSPGKRLELAESTAASLGTEIEERENALNNQIAGSLSAFSKGRQTYQERERGEAVSTAFDTQFGHVSTQVAPDLATISLASKNNPTGEPNFVAEREPEGEWQVKVDRLEPAQKARLLTLPQTPEQLERYKNITAVVNAVAQREPTAFERPDRSQRQLEGGLKLIVDTDRDTRNIRIQDAAGDTILKTRLEDGFLFSDEASSSYHLSPEQFKRLTAPEPELQSRSESKVERELEPEL